MTKLPNEPMRNDSKVWSKLEIGDLVMLEFEPYSPEVYIGPIQVLYKYTDEYRNESLECIMVLVDDETWTWVVNVNEKTRPDNNF